MTWLHVKPDPVNDWNTPMPPTIELANVANDLGRMGFDVHTVKVELDDGGWRVYMMSTDTDMLDHCHEFDLNDYGGIERI